MFYKKKILTWFNDVVCIIHFWREINANCLFWIMKVRIMKKFLVDWQFFLLFFSIFFLQTVWFTTDEVGIFCTTLWWTFQYRRSHEFHGQSYRKMNSKGFGLQKCTLYSGRPLCHSIRKASMGDASRVRFRLESSRYRRWRNCWPGKNRFSPNALLRGHGAARCAALASTSEPGSRWSPAPVSRTCRLRWCRGGRWRWGGGTRKWRCHGGTSVASDGHGAARGTGPAFSTRPTRTGPNRRTVVPSSNFGVRRNCMRRRNRW